MVPRAGELTQRVIGLAIDMHRDAWRALFERPCGMHKLRVMNGGTQAWCARCFRRSAIDKALWLGQDFRPIMASRPRCRTEINRILREKMAAETVT